MRLFLAINPPSELRGSLAEAMRPLRDAAPGLRWVSAERVHLTVRFLGDQPIERLAEIRVAVDTAAARHVEAPVALGRLGAFPNFRRARVVWLGVAPDPRLELLHHDVEEACVRLGFEPEGRPFRPHLTIARVPDGAPEEELRALHRLARSFPFEATIDVPSIDLMVSELSPEGPRYRLLHTSPLGAAV
ncbi:MAG: RNA 2',3'-cyclic phosphodiesterase [Gemmatimonadaceae bacterium]|nr:RNA 2',3'-cyclic phosphodiesterase [Gemmatimonadaceae bacterium]NUQ91831.1 RNA 2',3'-cyclic phosphodiesterase [Gemmatimonadaceae bacterium]NUR20890.1 RNA 2',3'-cyclic phosphodiesterase [Gemmatimonadaceae bacterium]NUS97671.1 RNA 2',3'-cyclic phosphodiesterase [Gemmatimonadaceae bacterium]